MRVVARSIWQGANLVLVLVLAGAAAGGCGSAAEPAATPTTRPAKPKSSFDPCADQPPPPKAYLGVLREARCDQEMYLTMATTAESLGVGCGHCHLPKAGGGPNDFDFPPMTPKKEVANWMKHELVERLRHKDGSPVTCASCHVGRDGKPVAKLLGEPRDPKYAMEWMSLVMVNEFTSADGSKLRCKDCHGAPPGMPGFERKLILEGELSALPVRTDLPPPGRPPEVAVELPAAVPLGTEAPPPTSAAPAPASASPAGSAAPPAVPLPVPPLPGRATPPR